MRWWLTVLIVTTTIAVSGAQPSFAIYWLSFLRDSSNNSVPIRINPSTGLIDLTDGVFVDSRFASVTADGRKVVFQVGSGDTAQIWGVVLDADNDGQVGEDPIDGSDNDSDGRTDEDPPASPFLDSAGQPILGLHPVASADGNHIAFASLQPYGGLSGTGNRHQVYILDRQQNRIVPISALWVDSNGDGIRDTYEPCLGNCIPVYVSADGRIVVFLAEWLPNLNIVDPEGKGNATSISAPPNNAPGFWLVLVHDRDADGNGIYDESGIGATRTFVGSPQDPNTGNYLPAVSVSISANGRMIAFVTPDDPANPDENWHVFVYDWQSRTGDFVRYANGKPLPAFAPSLSDDGTFLAYLTPQQLDNDGDGQVNEDPVDGVDNDNDGNVDEDPVDLYPQTPMDLVIRQLVDPVTGQPPSQIRELRLSSLQLPLQTGTADGSVGWGYSDWWSAASLAVDPTNPNIVYVAFHAWTTDLIDLQLVRNDLLVDPTGQNQPDRLRFYRGVPNIFLARFDFTNFDADPQAPNRIKLWRLNEWTDQQQPNKRRGLPISLTINGTQPQYRLTLAPNLLPTVSFINGNRLFVVFQSLAALDGNDDNGLWDIYLATVTLPLP